jgi:hypothetical protein
MSHHYLSGRLVSPVLLGTVFLFLGGFLGCSNDAPLDPLKGEGSISARGGDAAMGGFGSATFYPLAIGNTWDYEGSGRLTVLNPDGTPGEGGFESQVVESDRIIGKETIDGQTYFVREEVLDELPVPDGGRWITWSRMRQDREGLFAADVNSDQPPTLDPDAGRYAAPAARLGRPEIDLSSLEARGLSKEASARFAARIERLRDAARGRERGLLRTRDDQTAELTWLLYPLHIGVEWNMRPDMVWPARVDGVEMLDSKLGPLTAYRIETNPLGAPLGDWEYVRLFYGRVGFVGYSIHTMLQATDADGNPTLNGIYDEVRMLVAKGPNS